jgi:hypothetical protein
MKIQYVGKYPAKTDGIGEHDPGDIVEVPQEYGERLVRQRNWQKPAIQPKPVSQKKEKEARK